MDKVTLETAKKLGLTEDEFNLILKIMGRTPNFNELSIYSVMWSEHCSYKNSIIWLKTLPRSGNALLVEAGEENAGLVDIGDGLACAFKIESHNHPSAIEPYQGAATGVGGINRDIFTMGARPIAQLNSLRFGDLSLAKTKWLLKGVVKGIGDYGNAFGIPVLSGEVYFDESYNQNPLVNAMSVGIAKVGKTISATSFGVGNPVFIVGSATGKDGIHGATFASGDITDNSVDDLPSVQVGDPFQEKLLLEASMELTESDAIIGMQDMGAAGIICSTSEMSAKGKHGMNIYLDKVPTRQNDMKPFEILLSESQERMLVVVKKGREMEVQRIFDKWDLNCAHIGEVTQGPFLHFFMNNELVAKVEADSLVLGGGAPVYERKFSEPSYFAKNKLFDIDQVPVPNNLKEIAIRILKSPSISAKNWIFNQYDSMVGTANVSTNFPTSSGVILVKETNKYIALTVDCNSSYVHADPFIGAQIAVFEAARNIIASGGRPTAITNCLNFGNPYNENAYWQFVNAVKGIGHACNLLNTPVTGGNVSFYNQSVTANNETPVNPTPTIGMIGLIDDQKLITTNAFGRSELYIYIIGQSHNDINASEYLRTICKVKNSLAPVLNVNEELKNNEFMMDLIQSNLIQAANDISDGGLVTCLFEMAFPNEVGFDIQNSTNTRPDAFLFGEGQSRYVIAVDPKNESEITRLAKQAKVHTLFIGKTTTNNIMVLNENWGTINEFKNYYLEAIPELIKNN